MANPSSRLRVGIQGIQASFHDVAARRFFSEQNLESVECASFKKLAEALKKGQADFAVMAIENSIAGSILGNYSLLESYGFHIVGELYLRIELSLVALPGAKIADLGTVQSHPIALLQCEEFFFRNPHLKALEFADTAESAKQVADKKLVGYGAIASTLAAERFGLEVLEQGIETHKHNYTRFLLLRRAEDYVRPPHANKATLRFETAHEPGSLARVLKLFADKNINLTKIQSVPVAGKASEFSIHVDLEWEDVGVFEGAMIELSSLSRNVQRFGEYVRGQRPI